MRKVLPSAAILAVLTLALGGCMNFDAVSTSPVADECASAIQNQNAAWQDRESSESKIQKLELESLKSCKNLDEWSTAVSYNPGSMGYDVLSTEEAANLVYLACDDSTMGEEFAVCIDAAKRGYLD